MSLWNRDVSYTPKLVSEIISKGTDLNVTEVKLLGEGFDNTAFLINRNFVFRFVRRKEGLDFFKNEMIALPLLQNKLPLHVPNPLYKGIYKDKWPWSGYSHLQGAPFYSLDLGDIRRAESAEPLARFLKSLHFKKVETFSAAGLPNDWQGHMDISKRVPMCFEKLRKLVKKGLVKNEASYHSLMKTVSRTKTSPLRSLVHGDFKATHILFNAGLPASVIDWGDVHIGHPAADLSIAYTFFPPEGRKLFQEKYGSLDDQHLWRLAQFRALYHSLAIIEYSSETKQPLLLKEAQKALAWTFEN